MKELNKEELAYDYYMSNNYKVSDAFHWTNGYTDGFDKASQYYEAIIEKLQITKGWDDKAIELLQKQLSEAKELLKEYLVDIPVSGMSELERKTEKFLKQ
jgi:hypothetical protein